jgi:GxxExxY protein
MIILQPAKGFSLIAVNLDQNELPHLIAGVCLEVHRELGSALPEVVYRDCLARELRMRELIFERDQPLPILYRGAHIDSSEIVLDFVIENSLVLLVSSDEPGIDGKQELMTYLRLSGLQSGLWVNFGEPDLRRGMRRMLIAEPATDTKAVGGALSRN